MKFHDACGQLLVGACLLGMVGRGWAQPAPVRDEPIRGARLPAISPDGKRVVFVYQGDLWQVSAGGGRATLLTTHVAYDGYPRFSPDGRWVVFSSKRNGNLDLYLMPAEGGAARQLTWHSGNEIPGGWSRDGKRLLFAGKRDSANHQLFSVDVQTLRTECLMEDFAPVASPDISPDGRYVAYQRYGFPNWRPRYTGSAAAQIWLLDSQTGARRAVTQDQRQHLWPQFLPDGKHLLTVTVGEDTPNAGRLNEPLPPLQDNARRTPNLWVLDGEGKGRQLTEFVGGSVRSPSVAQNTGDIVFEYEHDLYLLKGGRGKPVRLVIYAGVDEKETLTRYERLTNGVTESEPSPDGKYVAFALRGDIWVVPVEKPKGIAGREADYAQRLTDWAGDDSDFMWSTNSRTLYFTSDREGNTRLYAVEVATRKVERLWARQEDIANPLPSPDGRYLAFWVAGPEGGLHVMTLSDRSVRRVAALPGPHLHGYGGSQLAWSPDSQWLAYVARSASRFHNLFLVKLEGGEPVNLTRRAAAHGQPAWSPDGKYLFFQSGRDGGGVYVFPLQPEEALASETDLKFEKPKDPVKVAIDFTDVLRRMRRFISQNPAADLQVTGEGQIVFLAEGDVWSASYDGKETKRVTTGGGKAQLRVLADGKRAFFIQNGELYQLRLPEGRVEKIAFTAELERDVRAERQAALAQFWRTYHRAFYDGHFHGRDWGAIRTRYEPLLGAVGTPEEFAALLQLMVGELEASHSEVNPPEPPQRVNTPHLGFTLDYRHAGPGLKVLAVPQGAPGWFKKTEIKPGEFILEINGEPVAAEETLYRLLNRRQGRELQFLVNDKPEKPGARTVKYKALTADEWSQLHYNNRIERLRKVVESRSQGRIGYVHISAMGGDNQNRFEQEVYEYMAGKEGMVIDVRFNRGGNISDTLIDWLERRQHGWTQPRDCPPEPAPGRAWDKRVVVLMNEHSYSNGEMFPCAMRQRGLARLVGTPTPGYVIWTWNFNLVDGTRARLPMGGVYRLDGTNQENQGEQPDVLVPLTAEDWLAERDPQLDKAIELLSQPANP